VHGDQARLIQLLRILVEHANEHCGGRTPSLHLHLQGDALRIDVVDGRAPGGGQLTTLLQQPQAEPIDEGLGLKLLIARAIAEAHGGTLTADTDPAGGLRLCCQLPLA
jgi:signal transduction histidine kinase